MSKTDEPRMIKYEKRRLKEKALGAGVRSGKVVQENDSF